MYQIEDEELDAALFKVVFDEDGEPRISYTWRLDSHQAPHDLAVKNSILHGVVAALSGECSVLIQLGDAALAGRAMQILLDEARATSTATNSVDDADLTNVSFLSPKPN